MAKLAQRDPANGLRRYLQMGYKREDNCYYCGALPCSFAGPLFARQVPLYPIAGPQFAHLAGKKLLKDLKSALDMQISGQQIMSWLRTCQNAHFKPNLLIMQSITLTPKVLASNNWDYFCKCLVPFVGSNDILLCHDS